MNKLVKEQNRDHNMENDIRTKTALTGPSRVEGLDEGKTTEEDEDWSVGEVAESREGVETVVDWPAAAGVDIAPFGVVEGVAEDDWPAAAWVDIALIGVVEGVAEGDAEVVVRAVEVWLGVTLTDWNEVTIVGWEVW